LASPQLEVFDNIAEAPKNPIGQRKLKETIWYSDTYLQHCTPSHHIDICINSSIKFLVNMFNMRLCKRL